MFGFGGSRESVQAAQASSSRTTRKAQAVNQAQAGASAGRGKRSVGGGGSTRKAPSRKF